MFSVRAYKACLHGQLSSNVRPHKHDVSSNQPPCCSVVFFRQAVRKEGTARSGAERSAVLARSRGSHEAPVPSGTVGSAEFGNRRVRTAREAQDSGPSGLRIKEEGPRPLNRSELAANSCAVINTSPSQVEQACAPIAESRCARRYGLAHPAAAEYRLRSARSRDGVAHRNPTDHEHHTIVREVRPNPSFKPTRYGRQRKPGLRHLVHHLSPGLRCPPPRAA